MMEQVSPPADPQNPHHLNPWWLFCTDSPYCDLFAAPPLAPLLQKQHTTTTASLLPSRKLTNPPSLPQGLTWHNRGDRPNNSGKHSELLLRKAGEALQKQTPICLPKSLISPSRKIRFCFVTCLHTYITAHKTYFIPFISFLLFDIFPKLYSGLCKR